VQEPENKALSRKTVSKLIRLNYKYSRDFDQNVILKG
jgi:hypothetical protein